MFIKLSLILSFLLFFGFQFAEAGLKIHRPPSALEIDTSKCAQETQALSDLVTLAKDCQWANGTKAVSAPSAVQNLCFDGTNGLSKQKFCSGQITSKASGARVDFPNIICRAQNGDCESATKCLQDFVGISVTSCQVRSPRPPEDSHDTTGAVK